MFENPFLNIAVSTSLVYIFIVLAIRLFGKKELAQLSVLDLVFILLISNAVQTAMVGPDTSLHGGLLAALTLFVLNFVFKLLLYRFKGLKKLVDGEPVLLIARGRIHERHLRELRLTKDELMEAVRQHGVRSITEVDLAIMEVDGSISILTDNFQKKSVRMTRREKALSRSVTVILPEEEGKPGSDCD